MTQQDLARTRVTIHPPRGLVRLEINAFVTPAIETRGINDMNEFDPSDKQEDLRPMQPRERRLGPALQQRPRPLPAYLVPIQVFRIPIRVLY